jgi:hypothetical protein
MTDWSEKLKQKTYNHKKLSDMSEEEFLDFYKGIPDDLKPFLLMTDCKQLTHAVNTIQKHFIPKKVSWWKFWEPRCSFCGSELLNGRTLHCGQEQCNMKYQKEKMV